MTSPETYLVLLLEGNDAPPVVLGAALDLALAQQLLVLEWQARHSRWHQGTLVVVRQVGASQQDVVERRPLRETPPPAPPRKPRRARKGSTAASG